MTHFLSFLIQNLTPIHIIGWSILFTTGKHHRHDSDAREHRHAANPPIKRVLFHRSKVLLIALQLDCQIPNFLVPNQSVKGLIAANRINETQLVTHIYFVILQNIKLTIFIGIAPRLTINLILNIFQWEPCCFINNDTSHLHLICIRHTIASLHDEHHRRKCRGFHQPPQPFVDFHSINFFYFLMLNKTPRTTPRKAANST